MERIQIIEMNNKYRSFLEKNLKDIEAKYIGKLTQKNKVFVELGQKFEKPDVLMGSHKDNSVFDEQEKILDLANGKNSVPVKIFLLKNDRMFAGNTKWALAYLKRYGDNVKLSQVPVFIVDLREEFPVVVDYNGSAYSQKNILKTVGSAIKLNDRVENGWRPKENKYTVGMLKNHLFKQINKENIYE